MNKLTNYKIFSIVSLLALTLSIGIIHPAVARLSTINIVAMPSVSDNVVYTITRVYQAPDYTSQVISVLSPGAHFNIIGYDASGAFTAFAKAGQSTISGWIPTTQLTRASIDGTAALTLSMGYLTQSSTSPIISVLIPGQKVKVLGHSLDGNWLAIANPGSVREPLYWVARGAVSLPEVVVKVPTLTMIYQKPVDSSLITNVLDPTHQLILIGRTSDSYWYATEDFSSGKFIGWVRSSEVVGGLYRDLLPVVNIK